MYWIVIIFGLVLIGCLVAVAVLLKRVDRARICRIDILVRLNKLEYKFKKEDEVRNEDFEDS